MNPRYWRSERVRLQPPFQHVDGLGWAAKAPSGFGAEDSNAAPRASRVRLFEGRRRLGPAHSDHTDIASTGTGAFSHWDGHVIFSTSDGSDPNANGRAYRVQLGPPKAVILSLGSCHLAAAVDHLQHREIARSAIVNPPTINTAAEAIQYIEHGLGRRDIPADVATFCALNAAALGERLAAIGAADVVILEVGAPISFHLDHWQLNFEQVQALILPITRQRNIPGVIHLRQWYNDGILKFRDDIRGRELELLRKAKDPRLAPVQNSVALEARCRLNTMAELKQQLHTLRHLTGKPLIVVSTSVLYTSSGKGVSFTPRFHDKLDKICGELDITVVHPHRLVEKVGVADALRRDRQHYKAAFIPVLADALLTATRALLPSQA